MSFHHNLIGEEPSSEGRGCGLYADVAGAGLFPHTEGEDIGHVCTLGVAVHAAEFRKVYAVGGDADDVVLRIENFGSAHLHEVGLYGAEAFHAAEVDGGIEACVLATKNRSLLNIQCERRSLLEILTQIRDIRL